MKHMSTSSPERVEDLSRRSGKFVTKAVGVEQETRLELLDGDNQAVEAREELHLRWQIVRDLCRLGKEHINQ